MKIIGLTGGIASGKNFISEIFAKEGAAIFDADAEVHKLLEADKSTLLAVKKKFPQAIIDNKIERQILGKIVFSDDEQLGILENILHPKVRKKYREFLKIARQEKKKLAILNVPLLLEKQGYSCDKIIAIIITKSEQKKRFLERAKKRNPKKFAAEKKNFEKIFSHIIAKQLKNSERKKAADFVINNLSKAETVRWIKEWLEKFL